jgi:GNAT superfamily N-acetyltransferase
MSSEIQIVDLSRNTKLVIPTVALIEQAPLIRHALTSQDIFIASGLEERCLSSRFLSLVAIEGQRVVACSLATQRQIFNEVHLDVPAIVGLGYRGRGIGSQILGDTLERLGRLGFTSARCYVREDNQEGVNFLTKMGFYFNGYVSQGEGAIKSASYQLSRPR